MECKNGHLMTEENTYIRPNGYKECRACKLEYNKKRIEKFPWERVWYIVNYRCKKQRVKKGKKNYLSKEDVKFLWLRDRAHLLKQPSIDRKDNEGHYTLENCEFIEKLDNLYKDSKPKPVLATKISDGKTQQFKSIQEACRQLGLTRSNADNYFSKKKNRKTIGGYTMKINCGKPIKIKGE